MKTHMNTRSFSLLWPAVLKTALWWRPTAPKVVGCRFESSVDLSYTTMPKCACVRACTYKPNKNKQTKKSNYWVIYYT